MKQDFTDQLNSYKKIIDSDIENFCEKTDKATLKTYGRNSHIVFGAFNELLRRGGKRIRGSLTLVGYEMCGGINKHVAVEAARVIEMMHVYMLIIDDIQDRADRRRHAPSVHKALQSEHRIHKWKGHGDHAGIALALNAALLGAHGAELILGNLDV